MLLIGIDCATDDAKVGVARGTLNSGALGVDDVLLCSKERSVVMIVADWIRTASGPVLIAIDAPLGWPVALGQTLKTHAAGEAIHVAAHDMFRRATDRFIQEKMGKTPLDVGADRIARTAHAALDLLGRLRGTLGADIPLAWSPQALTGVAAIEVYPAATLLAHGLRSSGYKKPTQVDERRKIIADLHAVVEIRAGAMEMERNADALDAAVCLLAAADFLRGMAMPPPDQKLARKEGWIWTRPRS